MGGPEAHRITMVHPPSQAWRTSQLGIHYIYHIRHWTRQSRYNGEAFLLPCPIAQQYVALSSVQNAIAHAVHKQECLLLLSIM